MVGNPNFLNGVPELLVLNLLGDREMYGYELVQAIRSVTGDVIVLGEGVIYPALHGLEADGALRSRRQTISGRSRIYYSLTPRGRARLREVTDSWVTLTTAIGVAVGRPVLG